MGRCLLLATLVNCLLFTSAWGGDWPQFRYDAGRTASSPVGPTAAAELELRWSRDLGSPRPAYPHEPRLRFDRSYEPVVSGSKMFVPSMIHDSVTALDVQTGERLWRFYTEGPVRFAPAVDGDRVYFVSDDGYLYCLDAADGALRWRFRGLPEGQVHRRVIGHGRLVSLWPARGGPVVADGVVYFAAGLWPTEGVFVHAVDAASGEAIWSNAEVDRIPESNWDHGVGADTGLTPQGYLAIVGDWLVVPSGAQLPAFLDRQTGRLHDYTTGWGGRDGQPKGTWFVAGVGDYFVHGGDLYDLTRPYTQRQANPGYGRWLYPGGWTRLEIDPWNHRELERFRQPVLTDETVYTSGPAGLRARHLSSVQIKRRDELSELPPHRPRELHPDTFIGFFDERWQRPSDHEVQMKAGRYLYVAGPGVIEAIDSAHEGQPEVVWRAEVEGNVHRMLAAAGKVFVVTEEGKLFAFGEPSGEPPLEHRLPPRRDSPEDRWTEKAEALVEAAGVGLGYAVVLGLEQGRLVEELARRSELHVVAVDGDADRVAAVRQRLEQAGLYGTQATVVVGDPLTYPLPPYLARLIVSEDPEALWQRAEPSALAQKVFQTLRPYGGTACWWGVSVAAGELQELVQEDQEAFAGARLRTIEDHDIVLLTRSGPVPGAGDWSHPGANAANTGASYDSLQPPLTVLWFDTHRWHKGWWPSATGYQEARVAGGRLVILEAGLLRAVDVYTGRTLWEIEVPMGAEAFPDDPAVRETAHRHGGPQFQREGPLDRLPPLLDATTQLVVVEDAIFVTKGSVCRVYDPATGEPAQRHRIDLPGDGGAQWNALRVWRDYLVGGSENLLFVVDRRTGEPIWQVEFDRRGFSLAVGGGKVFCAELVSPRRGEDPAKDGMTRAFDIATGELVWSRKGGASPRYNEVAIHRYDKDMVWRRQGGDGLRYSRAHDLLVTPAGFYRAGDGQIVMRLNDTKFQIRRQVERFGGGVELEDRRWTQLPGFIAGEKLVSVFEGGRYGSPYHVFLHDIPSGEPIGEPLHWDRRGCTSLRAGANLLTTRYQSNSAWIDLATGEMTQFLSVRPGCRLNNNMLPADGVLSMPNFSGGCSCNYSPLSVGFVPAQIVQPH